MRKPLITDVVFDFYGTRTQVHPIFKGYLETYRLELDKQKIVTVMTKEWQDAQAALLATSPNAGWTLGGCP